MRLKKLTIQAFGPFKDKITIDFTKEKIDNGLLLERKKVVLEKLNNLQQLRLL